MTLPVILPPISTAFDFPRQQRLHSGTLGSNNAASRWLGHWQDASVTAQPSPQSIWLLPRYLGAGDFFATGLLQPPMDGHASSPSRPDLCMRCACTRDRSKNVATPLACKLGSYSTARTPLLRPAHSHLIRLGEPRRTPLRTAPPRLSSPLHGPNSRLADQIERTALHRCRCPATGAC